MTETLAADVYTGGTGPEDFIEADLPPGMDGDDDEGDEAAPFGYTTGPDGTKRPKKAPGRPRKQPGAEELAQAPDLEREPDRAPQRPPGRRPSSVASKDDAAEPKMPKAGVIAAGVNKLYRRAGRFMRVLDADIGEALIYCADAEQAASDGEMTVGEAWENLAKTNPRIRRFILNAIMGGDISDLIMAHAPIGLALFMKPWVQRLIRLEYLPEAVAAEDGDEVHGEDVGGLTRDDIQQMQDMTAEQVEAMARHAASRMGAKVSEAEIRQVAAQARQQMRQQPKHKTRAQRAGAG